MTIGDWLDEISVKFDELGFVPTTLTDEKGEHFVEWFATEISEIKKEEERLKAENEQLKQTLSRMETVEKELRESSEKAAELPCKVGDTLYEPFINRIREWIVDSIYVSSLGTNVNCERKDDCRWHDHFAIRKNYNDFESRVYLTREAAEARLAELGEKK